MKKLFCAFVAAMIFTSGAFAAPSVMNFNEALLRDEAGNEWTAHGDPVLSSTQSISGGKSLYLDGNSYLQAKATEPFDLPREFTLEAWIFPQEWVSDHWGGATFTVFSRWLHGIRTLYLVNIEKSDDKTGKLTFYTDFAGMSALEGKASVSLNKWTHVAVTRDSEKLVRLFVNGKLEAEGRMTQDFSSTDYPMTIGASSNGLRKSVGYVDEWQVHKSCKYVADFAPSEAVHKSSSKPIKQEQFSIADEIRKFKGLLDEGIITQEEFDAVKKKLLGL